MATNGTERPGAAERPRESGAAALGRGGRMSRQRKTAAVLRLLRGEALETVSRSLGVTAATLSGWRDGFLAAGEAALATRPDSREALESARLKAKLGEVLVERDLPHEKIAALEEGRPLGRRRRRRRLDFPPWGERVRSERHAAERMAIPSMLARASAGVR